MPGAIKVLSFSEGTSVSAPASPSSFTYAGVVVANQQSNVTVGGPTTYGLQVQSSGTVGVTIGMDGSAAYIQSWNSKALTINSLGNSFIIRGTGGNATYMSAGGTAARLLTFTDSTTTNTGDTHTINAQSTTGVLNLQANALTGISISATGAVNIGPSGSGVSHIFNGRFNVQCPTGIADATDAIRVRKFSTTNTTSQVFVLFQINDGSTNSGSITANGANAATFTTTSDKKLKKNISPLPSQLDSILALNPVEFDFIDGSGHQIGFVAQDIEQVYPDVVSSRDDGILQLSGWSKTEARLVKAIQELAAKVEAKETKPKKK